MKKSNFAAWMLFLLGLLSQTQIRIIAYMDIAEFISYLLGPYFFFVDLKYLRRDGFGTFLLMWVLCTVSCVFSSYANGTYMAQWMRGLAVPISMFCLTCTFYHFLRQDFLAFKWFFLGVAISGIVSTFMFQRGTALEVRGETLKGDAAIESVTSYSLFWLSRISTWLLLPIYMFYMKVPRLYSISVGIFIMLFGFFSAGNRSGMIVTAAGVIVIVICGKNITRMRFVKKRFIWLLAVMALIVPMFVVFYKYCAVHNYLGEKAYQKYIDQTKQGTGAMALIRAGRSEFFIGLEACLDKPIVGHGPWAIDTNGYIRDYLMRYGDEEESKRVIEYMDKMGITKIIPAHSWFITFWLWYGIGGLICIIYVGWLLFTTLKNRMAVVPELFGYWAFALIPTAWHYFFSPFGGRTSNAMLLVLCLMTRAIERRQKSTRQFNRAALLRKY